MTDPGNVFHMGVYVFQLEELNDLSTYVFNVHVSTLIITINTYDNTTATYITNQKTGQCAFSQLHNLM